MAFDNHKNFALSTVATAPSPASSGTSLILHAGDGALFPAAPFNAVVWPAGVAPTAANAEVVRVTAVVSDTLTITRAQEASTARAIGVGDQIANAITSKCITDVETAIGASNTVLNGAGPPASLTGNNGDFYVDTNDEHATGNGDMVLMFQVFS